MLLYFNWDIYRFFYDKRGIIFALKVIPLHWLDYFYAGLSFIGGTLGSVDKRLQKLDFEKS